MEHISLLSGQVLPVSRLWCLKSSTAAIDFDVSAMAPLSSLSILRPLRTAQSSIPFAIDVSLSSTISEFLAIASVTSTTKFSLCWSVSCHHFVSILWSCAISPHQSRAPSFKPSTVLSRVPFASACCLLIAKFSAHDVNPAASLSLLISVECQPFCSRTSHKTSHCRLVSPPSFLLSGPVKQALWGVARHGSEHRKPVNRAIRIRDVSLHQNSVVAVALESPHSSDHRFSPVLVELLV